MSTNKGIMLLLQIAALLAASASAISFPISPFNLFSRYYIVFGPDLKSSFPAQPQKLANSAMNEIFLLAPTTLPERREQVLKHGGGFIYYVSVKGVTGSKALDAQDVGEHVQAIKAQTALPVCVGFGIRDGASAKAVGQYADGVIIGSELVKNFADVGNDEQKIAHAKKAILDKMDELREAIDSLE